MFGWWLNPRFKGEGSSHATIATRDHLTRLGNFTNAHSCTHCSCSFNHHHHDQRDQVILSDQNLDITARSLFCSQGYSNLASLVIGFALISAVPGIDLFLFLCSRSSKLRSPSSRVGDKLGPCQLVVLLFFEASHSTYSRPSDLVIGLRRAIAGIHERSNCCYSRR